MESETATIIELKHRHHQAARRGDEVLRRRLFDLIGEVEWAFPVAASQARDLARATETEKE